MNILHNNFDIYNLIERFAKNSFQEPLCRTGANVVINNFVIQTSVEILRNFVSSYKFTMTHKNVTNNDEDLRAHFKFLPYTQYILHAIVVAQSI